MPSKFMQGVQHLIFSFKGGNWTESSESYLTKKQSQQEANQVMILKGNTGRLKCTKLSTLWPWNWKTQPFRGEELDSQDPKQGHGPRSLLTLPCLFLILDKEVHSFSTYQGLRKSFELAWLPMYQQSFYSFIISLSLVNFIQKLENNNTLINFVLAVPLTHLSGITKLSQAKRLLIFLITYSFLYQFLYYCIARNTIFKFKTFLSFIPREKLLSKDGSNMKQLMTKQI